MTDNEIKKALDDISAMKQSINSNLQIMKPILLDRNFTPFCYVSGIFFTIVFAGLHFMLATAGSFAAIPTPIKGSWVAFTVLGLVFLSLYKTLIISKSIRKQSRKLTIFDLFTVPEFRDVYLLLLYGAIIFCIGTAFVAARLGDWWIFMPSAGLTFSFYLAVLAQGFRVREYLVLSVSSLAISIAMPFFMHGTEFLWLAAYLGGLSFLYGIMIQFSKGNR